MLRRKRGDRFDCFSQLFRRLLRQGIHNINIYIIKPHKASEEKRAFKILIRMYAGKCFQLVVMGALKSEAETVYPRAPVNRELVAVKGAGVCFHRNFCVFIDVERPSYRADYVKNVLCVYI